MASKLIEELSRSFALSEKEIRKVIDSAPRRYKVYSIAKKRGGKRIIAQPAREVKALQYWMMENILAKCQVHPAAAAYVRGLGIRDNASKHAKNRFLMKMDFVDFFPSIKPIDFKAYLEKTDRVQLSQEDVRHGMNILFWQPKNSQDLQLSIGAPSSPSLSNLVMFDFDQMVDTLCKGYGVVYTRYADDLTFSTNSPGVLSKIHSRIGRICKDLKSPRLTIKTEKTVFSSMKNRRRVTGLIISNDGEVSLGRERKRIIRAQIFHFKNKTLDKKEIATLKGWLAFAMDVEQDFVKRMRKKYGSETIDLILNIDRSST